jgi:phospholipid/cholesterol/gamma-HCH transport system substrate-binding protein
MASVRNELGVGCLMLAAAAVTAFLALKMGALGGLGHSSVHVTVALADAAGLKADAPVSVAGVAVGSVESLRAEGDHAEVGLALDADAALYRDAHLRVRAASLLGEKYLEIEPGTPEAGRVQDGDVLPAVGPQIEIDELVGALGPVLAAIDPEDLGKAIAALARALEEDPDRLSRMLANADTALGNAATASADLPAAVSELRSTMSGARGTLGGVDARIAEVRPVIARADGILAGVERADPGALVGEVRTAVGETRSVVATLDASGKDLAVILDNLSEIDRAELERMLREEGVLIRLFPKKAKKHKEP